MITSGSVTVMAVPEDSVTVFKSQFDAIDMLPTDKEQLLMYRAVLNHQFYGLEPDFSDAPYLAALYSSWLPVLDKSKELRRIARENGKKGGAPIGNQNARKNKTTGGLIDNKLKENKKEKENLNIENDYEDPTVSDGDEEESGRQSINVKKVYLQ